MKFIMLLKGHYQCNCATAAVAAELVAAVALQVQYGPQTKGRISQRVSGLSHDSMCGSWFTSVLKCVWCGLGLVDLFIIIFSVYFLNLHVGVTATCSAGLLVCSFELLFFETFMLQVLKYTDSLNTQGLHFSMPPASLFHAVSVPHAPQRTRTRPKPRLRPSHPPRLPPLALSPVCRLTY